MAETPQKNYTNFALVVLLVVAAFLIGSLYTKVSVLEKGGGGGGTGANVPNAQPTGQTASKYKTLDDALVDFAKQVGIDGDKLLKCANSGEKKSIVEADTKQGESVGVSGTPGFFVNGRFIGGAYPYETFKELIDKELAGQGSDDSTAYSDTLQQAFKGGNFNPVPKEIDLGKAVLRGDSSAKVTIVEFSDFQCPFCERSFPTMNQVMEDYKGKVKLAYKHFPLVSIHPKAQKAAEAAECAKDQGKFWEFHDKLFGNYADWANI